MGAIQKATRVPSSVHDYTVLALGIPAVSSFPKSTRHFLYLQPNAPKVPTLDTPREVFLVNLPIDVTEAHVRSLFANQLGGARVEKVEFEGVRTGRKLTAPVAPKAGRKRKRANADSDDVALPETWDREVRSSGATAVATFVDVASAEVAVKEAKRATKAAKEVVWGLGVEDKLPALGSARYLAHHTLRYPSASTLQVSVDSFMTTFASQEAARVKLLARQRAPDEDGFITVVRGGRAGPARLEEAQEKAEKQKEKQKGKEDFYRFQLREKRKERAGDLLRGFEEDRRKVEEMKKRRNKFRPN
ncbi:hypothetical protein MBLNU459_g6704t1 [Dothideomycetes sp. NU459]